MGKLLRKALFSGALLGVGYVLFSKKGREIQRQVREQLPAFLVEVKARYAQGRATVDEVIDEVILEWEHAKKLMEETAAPLKREAKRRMKK